MRLGYFLASEEFGPHDLIDQAQRAEAAGFHGLWISDHFHPWLPEQGQSPFVWSTIGAIAQATSRVTVTTGVTCPTVRIHPAVIAHATATVAVMLEGRFRFGVGTGEALNEHVLGDAWPEADIRLEMLEEAVEVIRLLWSGGQRSHRGRHYTVSDAELFTRPSTPPPILVSGFGPKAIALAGRIGDGFCTMGPDADGIAQFREGGGGDAPVHAGMKVCFGADEAACRRTAHARWRNQGAPGELAQVLPTPAHFDQVSELVTEDAIASSILSGPDVDAIRAKIDEFEQAGVDELYIGQVGDDQEAFFAMAERELLPRYS